MADDNERLVGLLKFQPREFMDDVINAVHDYVCDGMDGLEEALTATALLYVAKHASCCTTSSQRAIPGRLGLSFPPDEKLCCSTESSPVGQMSEYKETQTRTQTRPS